MNSRSDSESSRGSSLVDVLVAASIIGLLSSALAGVARSITPVAHAVSESLELTRDIQRIHDSIATDLTIHSTIDVSPGALPHLPGSNVMSLSESDAEDSRHVSYRYISSTNAAHLVRIAFDDVSTEPSNIMILSTRLATPPDDWVPGDSVSHAIVSSISDESPSGVERVLDIEFATGASIRVSGRHQLFEPISSSTSPEPSLPIVRCAGSITIVLNTSSSIWSLGAAATITKNVSDFVTSLSHLPIHVRLLGFDRAAYVIYPDAPVGSFVDLLTSSTATTTLHSRLTSLGATSSNWRNGRNWEDGLWQATRPNTGPMYSHVPDLIVFLTDGSPNRNKLTLSSDTDATFHPADLTRASIAADYARSVGATLVGILLGSGADAAAIGHLSAVFGPLTWEGSNDLLPWERARTFTRPVAEGFSRLDQILSLIAAWRCAGTLTLQQRIISGGTLSPISDTWTFDVVGIDQDVTTRASVDPRRPSTTIDLGIDAASGSRELVISQNPRTGYRHHSAACTAAGQTVPVSTVTDSTNITTLRVTAPARTAMSCTLTSETVS